MKNAIIAGLIAACIMMLLGATSRADAAPPTTCKDGTTSTSTGKGTCSARGVQRQQDHGYDTGRRGKGRPAKTSNARTALLALRQQRYLQRPRGVQKPAAAPAY